ncbi:MAG: ABC transporter substrate-binding protein [Gemmatimonadota bacterium]
MKRWLVPVAAWWALSCTGERPDPVEAGSASTDSAAVQPFVEDDLGRKVPLTPFRRRVISLVPSMTETLVAMGAVDLLVGRTDFDVSPMLKNFPSVGGGLAPNLEILTRLHPDLVVVWAKGRMTGEVPRMEAHGATVYAMRVESTEDFRRHARKIGKLIGRATAADSLVRAVDEELELVAAAVRSSARPEVLYVIWPDPLTTTGGGTFIDSLIATAGGRNVFSDLPRSWPVVSLEEVVFRNPSVVILPDHHGGREAGWRFLAILSEARVIEVDGNLFSRPGPRMGLAARRLSEALHPEVWGMRGRTPPFRRPVKEKPRRSAFPEGTSK